MEIKNFSDLPEERMISDECTFGYKGAFITVHEAGRCPPRWFSITTLNRKAVNVSGESVEKRTAISCGMAYMDSVTKRSV